MLQQQFLIVIVLGLAKLRCDDNIISYLSDATPSESNQPATSEIHSRAKEVSGLVQCVCMTETPTPQPKRLVVTSVIKDILLSIISSLSHLDEFFNSDLCHDDSTGLK